MVDRVEDEAVHEGRQPGEGGQAATHEEAVRAAIARTLARHSAILERLKDM